MDYTSIHTHKATCIGYINVQPLYSVDTPTAILQCGALLGNQSNWEYWPQRNFLYKKVVHTSSRWKCTFYAFLEICSQRIHWFAINNIHKNYIFAYGVWYEYFLFFFFFCLARVVIVINIFSSPAQKIWKSTIAPFAKNN